MTVEDIITYVLKTPENVNPNVLRGMLAELAAGGSGDLDTLMQEEF